MHCRVGNLFEVYREAFKTVLTTSDLKMKMMYDRFELFWVSMSNTCIKVIA